MFEIGIFCVIFLAVSYWAVLWLMGRREDVLHGEFVTTEEQLDEGVRPVFPEPPVRPVMPERPSRPAPSERPVQAAPEQPEFRPERLEQLLASIKQDLSQLVRK
jgi:hypothetical protein